MKVLHLCKFFPPDRGGMETVAFELAEGLARRAVEVEVVCAAKGPRTRRDVAPAGYRVTRAASWGRWLATSIAPALHVEYLRARAGADIVHVHLPDPLTASALRLAPPAARLVVHWHSDVVRQRFGRLLYDPLQRWLLDRADAVVATSPAYAASSPWLQACRDKVVVVPIGIGDPPRRADPAAVRSLHERFGGRRIVFALGRMSAYKGFDVLIDAAARLPDDIAVVVGGEGELLDTHRQSVARRGLGSKVHFVGPVSDDELPAWLEAASVFCLPSTLRSEAYGVAIVEAMARARPVVATSIDGSGVPFVNVDGETGFNVPVGDSQALAEALLRIVDNPGLVARFGNSAARRFRERFTASAMVDATLRLYERVLADAPGPYQRLSY